MVGEVIDALLADGGGDPHPWLALFDEMRGEFMQLIANEAKLIHNES